MIEREAQGVGFLQFSNLSRFPTLRHGIFTRRGGSSGGPFESLNVGLTVGDAPGVVEDNRRAVSRVMGDAPLVFIRQVHGGTVLTCDPAAPQDPPSAGGGIRTGDAIICATPGANLVIQTADCQPVLLFDPIRGAVAGIHSGWRGSIDNIIGETVKEMRRRFECRPRDLIAGIGPSLGPCCAEFRHFRREIPAALWRYRISAYHFDFWAMSRDQLLGAGLAEAHIEQSRLCTRCRTDLFFSYRAVKKTGRFASVIGLAEGNS
jgi:hypothetical protein